MTLVEVAANIGISVVAAAGTILAGAKLFAGKWLDARFSQNLEAVKLEGQKQLESARQEHTTHIERTKFERAGLLDRAAKLNQREFEIIPDIWKHATEAHYAILRLIARWQESPDVGRMSEPQFEAFVESSRLETWQKEEIRTKGRFERTTYYSEINSWLRLQDASEALVGFNRSAANGSIFLHPDTHAEIEKLAIAMRTAFIDFSIDMRSRSDGDPIVKDKENDPVQAYRNTGETQYQELARFLRERYWITPQGEAM